MPALKKETRIKREIAKLEKDFAEIPDNKKIIVRPLIENAAFMKITLEDLQKSINENGCAEEYQNGANQKGKKASADLQAYNALVKNYNIVSDRLEKLLPQDRKSSKLKALREE